MSKYVLITISKRGNYWECYGWTNSYTNDELPEKHEDKLQAVEYAMSFICPIMCSCSNAQYFAEQLAQTQYHRAMKALQSLYDEQNGAPLPRYEESYNKAMNAASIAISDYQRMFPQANT